MRGVMRNIIETDPDNLDCMYEERAAILEYDAHYSRYQAEQRAAQMYGFDNKADFKRYIQKRKAKL